jgi:Uma2 family endonuclease
MTAQTLKLPILAFEKNREVRTRPKPPEFQAYEMNEPYPHGWRYVTKTLPNGEQRIDEIPLKPEDFLDPQLGDVMPQRTKHARCNIEIFNRLDNRYADDPTIGVFSDLKIQWGIPGLKEPSPDIAVIKNLKDKEPDLGTFKVLEQGSRPCLVIEIMSPNYPGDDTEKVQIYQQAGVEEYVIINPYNKAHQLDYTLIGYRLKGTQYQPIKPDKQGRIKSQTTGVWFQVAEDHQSLILIDAHTNEKLLTAKEEKAARLEEKAARLEAEAKMKALEKRLQELEAKQK